MKVTYNWLKDFVDIKIPASELAEKLTMAGLEVKSIEEKSGDFVFEIEITSNRPDWLGVIGIAREVAAITGRKLKKSPVLSRQSPVASSPVTEEKRSDKISIEIEDKKDCPLYTARIIRGVKVGISPLWLRDRLELVGLRSVNNVVDITNYVLFEMGEPLHAFDLDKLLAGPIIVRRAKNDESLVSIDGENRKLSPETVVIADSQKPVALAGVRGAKDTEVAGGTQNILLEAAIFNPVIVRRSRQKLGMASDASYRFERGIDPGIVEAASLRAAQLILECCGGKISASQNRGSVNRKDVLINFSAGDVLRYLGINIPAVKLKNILLGLGFVLKPKNKNIFAIKVPSWRPDVLAGIDLIEEISRIYGYENIPSTLAAVTLKSQKSKNPDYIPFIKDIFVSCGLNEVITYSLIEKNILRGFWDKKDALIAIANPLSLEQEIMRPMLMPSLIQRIAYNLRQQNSGIKIFEIAKTYKLENNGKVKEKYSLGLAFCGAESKWLGPELGHVQVAPGLLHLKGIIETLLERLGIGDAQYRLVNNTEVEVLVKGKIAGVIKNLPQEILEGFDIKHKEVFAAEIYLEEDIFPLIRLERKFNAAGVPRYPGVTRDITIPVKKEVPFEEISAAIYELKEPLLTNVFFQDCYEGEKVLSGTKRITVSLHYGSFERTLTEEEVVFIHGRILQALEMKFRIS